MKGVRAACDEVGIGAARSINETIERMETHVQRFGLEGTAWAGKWGLLMEFGGEEDDENFSGL
jgi:hypothetical protein